MKFFLCMLLLLSNIVFSKNIYVVYDDSLSMKKESRDIYANYAVQTLTSLLSEEDNLTITKMSDIKEEFRNKTIVDLNNINKELKYFDKNLIAKSQVTPYKSIETIVDYIDKTYSKDDSNWLIVITDGEFEDGKVIPNIEGIKNSISKTVQKTNLKPVFLLIGSNQSELEKYEKQEGIQIWKDIFGEGEFPKIFKASNQKDIITKMREIAQLLTSKSSKNLDEIYTVNNNRLEFNSLFPLSKIIFLDQAEGTEKLNVLEKVYIDGKEITVDKQYKPLKNERKILLAANVIHIEGSNNKIVLEFKDNVTRNIKVLPEVSAKFKVSLIDSDGKELKNGLLEIPAEEKFKVIAKLLKGDSNDLLDHVNGTEVILNYGNKKISLKYNENENIYEGVLEIEKGRKSIDGTAEFPGYFYYQSDIYIIDGTAPKPKVIKKIEEPKPELPKPEPPKPYVMSIDIFPEINDFLTQEDLYKKQFFIVPKINGKKLLEEEISVIDMKLKSDIRGTLSEKKYIDTLDSYGWEYVPNLYSGISNYKNPQGENKIEVTLENKEKNKFLKNERVINLEKISFWSAFGNLIVKIILLMASLILIIGYIKKNRFKKGEKIIIEEIQDNFKKPVIRKVLNSTFINKIIPYKDDECNIEGFVFIANKGFVGITAESFNRSFNRSSVSKVYINGDYVDKDELKTGKKDIYRLYNEDNIEFVFDNSGRKKYIYKIEK